MEGKSWDLPNPPPHIPARLDSRTTLEDPSQREGLASVHSYPDTWPSVFVLGGIHVNHICNYLPVGFDPMTTSENTLPLPRLTCSCKAPRGEALARGANSEPQFVGGGSNGEGERCRSGTPLWSRLGVSRGCGGGNSVTDGGSGSSARTRSSVATGSRACDATPSSSAPTEHPVKAATQTQWKLSTPTSIISPLTEALRPLRDAHITNICLRRKR